MPGVPRVWEGRATLLYLTFSGSFLPKIIFVSVGNLLLLILFFFFCHVIIFLFPCSTDSIQFRYRMAFWHCFLLFIGSDHI